MSITDPVKNGLANLGITQGSRLAVGDSSNAGRSQVEPVDLPISHASDDGHAYSMPHTVRRKLSAIGWSN